MRWADFEGYFERDIKRVLGLKEPQELHEYAMLFRRAYTIFANNGVEVGEPSAKFYLLFLNFLSLIPSIKATSEEELEVKSMDLIDNFYVDFVLPYTYVKEKSHVMWKVSDENVISEVSNLVSNEAELLNRYFVLKEELRREYYPFDISKPVVRLNFRNIFEREWHSIIILAYPESRITSVPHLDIHMGRQWLSIRSHTTVYIEVLVNGGEVLVFLNKGSRELKQKEKEAVHRIFNEVLGIPFGTSREISPSIPSDKETYVSGFVKNIGKNLSKGFDSVSKILESIKHDLCERALKSNITRKEEVAEFFKSMRLVGVELKASKKKKVLVNYAFNVVFPEAMGEEVAEEEIKSKLRELFKAFKVIQDYYKVYDADVVLLLTFEGVMGENRKSRLSIGSNNKVIFSNMRRDEIAEVLHVLNQVT